MKRMTAVLAGAMLLMGMATAAQAVPTLTLSLSDGTSSVTVLDNSAGDLNPLLGSISYLDAVGFPVWSSFEVNSGISKPNIENSSVLSVMDLHFNGTSTGAGTFTLTLMDTGFNLNTPNVSPNTEASLQIGGTSSALGSVKFDALYNGNLIGSTLSTGSPFADTAVTFLDTVNAYSLTEILTITHTKAGITTGDAYLALTPVPEPGTMMLLGAGFLGLAIYGKRRKNA